MAGRCPNHVVPILERRGSERHAAAVEAWCRRLRCPSCLHRRRALWLGHFAAKLAAAAKAGVPLFFIQVPRGLPWEALNQQIGRLRGEYARVSIASGEVVVITTAPVGDTDPIYSSLALELLAEGLECLDVHAGGRSRPISASRNWRLHEKRGRIYRCRGMAPRGGFGRVMQEALASGMTPRVDELAYGKLGQWRFPPDWTAEQQDAFFAHLCTNANLRFRTNDRSYRQAQ